MIPGKLQFSRSMRVALAILATACAAVASFGQGYNLKLGSLEFNLTGSLRAEYNDNVNASAYNPLDDFILAAGLHLQGNWRRFLHAPYW